VINAGSLNSYGVEADFVEVPHPTLVLGQSVGFNKAIYDDFTGAQCTAQQLFDARSDPARANSCTQDLAGKPLDNAPEWTLSAWAQWEREIPSLPLPVYGFVRGEWSYRDRFFLQQDLDPALVQDPVNILNVRVGIRDPDDRWQVTLWTENVTNSTYYVAGFDVPLHNGWAGVVAPPRTYGLQVRLRF
jgi:iron complex outermembrane receptor protein